MSKQLKKANIHTAQCVACGCCVKVCPKQALSIYNGIYAAVNTARCVGCGKCVKECPASVIRLEVSNS